MDWLGVEPRTAPCERAVIPFHHEPEREASSRLERDSRRLEDDAGIRSARPKGGTGGTRTRGIPRCRRAPSLLGHRTVGGSVRSRTRTARFWRPACSATPRSRKWRKRRESNPRRTVSPDSFSRRARRTGIRLSSKIRRPRSRALAPDGRRRGESNSQRPRRTPAV